MVWLFLTNRRQKAPNLNRRVSPFAFSRPRRNFPLF